jgi:hypothetical protein
MQKKEDQLLEWVRAVQRGLPGADVCCHWSIKQHYKRGPEGTHSILADFLAGLAQTASSQGHDGLPSVMLVNGSGPKRPYTTVTALEMLQAGSQDATESAPLHVCFNPYFPDESDRESERQRLRAKLQAGTLHGVWLQMGSDSDLLRQGIDHVHKLCRELEVQPQLYGAHSALLNRHVFCACGVCAHKHAC